MINNTIMIMSLENILNGRVKRQKAIKKSIRRKYKEKIACWFDLNTLAEILHLFVGLGLIRLSLCRFYAAALPSHHPPEAFYGSCIPSFSHSRP